MNNRKEKTMAKTTLLSIVLFCAVQSFFLSFALEISSAQGLLNPPESLAGGGSGKKEQDLPATEPRNA